MKVHEYLFAFTDLLVIAQLCSGANPYEFQEQLVEQCRREGRPFVARMPYRHQFGCDTCGSRIGDSLMHFEDPRQPLPSERPRKKWGVPAGRYYAANRSELHAAFAHGEALPEELKALFEGLR